MKRQVESSPAFERSLRRYLKKHPEAAETVAEAISKLGADAYTQELGIHKLKGNLSGILSAELAYDLRLLFEIETRGTAEVVLLLKLGTHDEVYGK
ncbi:MAG: type II toxin-antitoxin system YafQ family toxin [Lacipirellulaceae bacterium]